MLPVLHFSRLAVHLGAARGRRAALSLIHKVRRRLKTEIICHKKTSKNIKDEKKKKSPMLMAGSLFLEVDLCCVSAFIAVVAGSAAASISSSAGAPPAACFMF